MKPSKWFFYHRTQYHDFLWFVLLDMCSCLSAMQWILIVIQSVAGGLCVALTEWTVNWNVRTLKKTGSISCQPYSEMRDSRTRSSRNVTVLEPIGPEHESSTLFRNVGEYQSTWRNAQKKVWSLGFQEPRILECAMRDALFRDRAYADGGVLYFFRVKWVPVAMLSGSLSPC